MRSSPYALLLVFGFLGMPGLAMSAPPALAFPLACRIGQSCEVQNYVDRDPGPGAKDYRCGSETYQAHNGLDIRIADLAAQRAGVAVLAAAPGRVSRLRDGVLDVSVKAAGAPAVTGQECGNGLVIDHGDSWETQYCHLARGSLRVKVGEMVAVGQPIASVGLSGFTQYPHLHITVRHGGAVVDPMAVSMAPGACEARSIVGASLWTPSAQASLAYKPGAVLNAGFSGVVLDDAMLEAGGLAPPGQAAAVLVAYVRAINLQLGDVQTLVLKDPAGAILAQSKAAPLDHSKAQVLLFVGRKQPVAGWAHGVYHADYAVLRGGAVVVRHSFEIRL